MRITRSDGATFWHKMPPDNAPSSCSFCMRRATSTSSPAMAPKYRCTARRPLDSLSTPRAQALASRAQLGRAGASTAMRRVVGSPRAAMDASSSAATTKRRTQRDFTSLQARAVLLCDVGPAGRALVLAVDLHVLVPGGGGVLLL